MEKLDSNMTDQSGENQIDLKYEAKPIIYSIAEEITLTEQEKNICDFIINALKENGKTTTVRICGGWVRDKLMGKESNDIDIALDDMYGEELAEIIRNKIESENPTGDGKQKKGYGVVKNNSDKSKHLEVAVIKLYDCFIDIVNLRSEEYA